jgi:2-dehydropantoate 2-reductase
MRNGVSAATGMSGNERDGHEIIRRVVIRLAGEAIRTGQAHGYLLGRITGIDPLKLLAASEGDPKSLAEVEAHMTKGASSAARSNIQRPSMAQDIQKGRRTEIGELNGFIVQKAKEAGGAAPTHERVIDIVRRVERNELAPRPELLFDLAA